jgi:iron(III) transport system permease protein
MSATTDSARAPAARASFGEAQIAFALVFALCAALILLIAAAAVDAAVEERAGSPDGAFVGLANFMTYATTPALVAAAVNSVVVAGLSTAIVVPLAFVYAYALQRSCMPGKGMFMAAALLPIFAPSLLSALALVYVFGNQGIFKAACSALRSTAPSASSSPQVALLPFRMRVLILSTALALADGRLYEAAEALGTSRMRIFRTVTLPGARYGLVSAIFVVFTLVITDFGIPKVIGGQFNVLATDAYKQVVGQQNFPMGAVVGRDPARAGGDRLSRRPARARAAGGAALGAFRALCAAPRRGA